MEGCTDMRRWRYGGGPTNRPLMFGGRWLGRGVAVAEVSPESLEGVSPRLFSSPVAVRWAVDNR